jgi:hypothetical protein
MAMAVERYIEWKAFTLWLGPLLFSDSRLTPEVFRELERRCPATVRRGLGNTGADTARPSVWRRVVEAGNQEHLTRAIRAGMTEEFLNQTCSHPWHVRTHIYAARQSKESKRRVAFLCPSFRQWRRAAANYIEPS